MKTLSAANQTNIKQRHQQPEILVKFSGLSLEFALGLTDGYLPEVTHISPIRTQYDPYRGCASWSDVEIELAPREYGNQLVEDHEFSNESMEIVAKYGSDADIPIWKGVVDCWVYQAGVTTIKGVTKSELHGLSIPDQQINATNFASYFIPAESDGKWIPLTIGQALKPFGRFISYGGGIQTQAIFNKNITNHAGIGALLNTDFWIFDSEYLYTGGSGQITATDVSKGEIKFADQNEFYFEKIFIPIHAEWSSAGAHVAGTDPSKAIDEDDSTFALLDDPAATPGVATGVLHLRLPEISFSAGLTIKGMWIVGKFTKLLDMNDGARTQEEFHGGLEYNEGTVPAGNFITQIITDSQSSRDNLPNTRNRALCVVTYATELGDSINGLGVGLSPSVLSRKIFDIICTEEDTGSDADYFRIYEAYLLVWLYTGLNNQQIHGDLAGYDDDGSGTYTGSANSLIETPCDVIYFLLDKYLDAFSDFNSTAITAARTGYGDYILSGQETDQVDAEAVIKRMVYESRMIFFVDASGEVTMKRFDIPSSADKTIDYEAADFATLDEGGEGEVESVTLSPTEQIYNQFDILYNWDEGYKKFNSVLHMDENTAGAVGTWLTDSQSTYNVTRRLTVEAKWIQDTNTAQSFGNALIYRHADRHQIVHHNCRWNALDIEMADTLTLLHPDVEMVGGESNLWEVIEIETDVMSGIISMTGFQADATHAALPDPT